MSEGKLIYKKMVDVMRDIGAVGKDQTNKLQGFKFRGVDQFVNAAHPALVKHGVFVTTEVVEKTYELREVERSSGKKGLDKHVHLTMKYTFFAEDGSFVTSTLPSESLDSGDKATNKALSAALKYAFIQTFSVPTSDMEDPDKYSPTITPPETVTATVDHEAAVAEQSEAVTKMPSKYKPVANGAKFSEEKKW